MRLLQHHEKGRPILSKAVGFGLLLCFFPSRNKFVFQNLKNLGEQKKKSLSKHTHLSRDQKLKLKIRHQNLNLRAETNQRKHNEIIHPQINLWTLRHNTIRIMPIPHFSPFSISFLNFSRVIQQTAGLYSSWLCLHNDFNLAHHAQGRQYRIGALIMKHDLAIAGPAFFLLIAFQHLKFSYLFQMLLVFKLHLCLRIPQHFSSILPWV